MNREAIIHGEGILGLIPQRPPIVMVDSFFGIEENCSYSGLTVTPDNIFCEAENCKNRESSSTSPNRQPHVSGLSTPGKAHRFR